MRSEFRKIYRISCWGKLQQLTAWLILHLAINPHVEISYRWSCMSHDDSHFHLLWLQNVISGLGSVSKSRRRFFFSNNSCNVAKSMQDFPASVHFCVSVKHEQDQTEFSLFRVWFHVLVKDPLKKRLHFRILHFFALKYLYGLCNTFIVAWQSVEVYIYMYKKRASFTPAFIQNKSWCNTER